MVGRSQGGSGGVREGPLETLIFNLIRGQFVNGLMTVVVSVLGGSVKRMHEAYVILLSIII